MHPDLPGYLRGTLPADRHAAVDAWLAGMPEDEAGRLLAEAEARPGLGLDAGPAPSGFSSEAPRMRLDAGGTLGEGGMAVVLAARDRVLDRPVAVKVLKPRGPGEDLATWHSRAAAFRREAALTAGLEHPAIPPVHDVGSWDGRPAFAMKRLEGRTLASALAAGIPSGDLVEPLLRVAEAMAYAHSRGVVHRDLSPANILLGDFGQVHVLDWGLAARRGESDGLRVGTPGWAAPEQAGGAPADPRMDVFALGALLEEAWRGHPPASLAAVAARCRQADPERRYRDGGEVAAELRRWLEQGVTLAEQARPWELALIRLRRSRRVRFAALAAALAAAGFALAWWWQSAVETERARARLEELARAPLDRPEALSAAATGLRLLRAEHPGLEGAAALAARMETAQEIAAVQARAAAVHAALAGLLVRTRQVGPWAVAGADWRRTLADAGLALDGGAADGERLRSHPLRAELSASLAFLWRAEREREPRTGGAAAAGLLAAAGPDPSWRALGRLLARAEFRAHDPVFCACADSDAVLAGAGPSAVALALFAPEERLSAFAAKALAADPGGFWPLLACARAELAAGHAEHAERLALVASGAEPGSLPPRLVLAYAALALGRAAEALAETERGLAIDPANAELEALRALALLRAGRRAEAQAQMDAIAPSHLRWHLAHPVGHPMEKTVQALVEAGLTIPAGPPAPETVGPLSR